jgi:hypothetical protein
VVGVGIFDLLNKVVFDRDIGLGHQVLNGVLL